MGTPGYLGTGARFICTMDPDPGSRQGLLS